MIRTLLDILVAALAGPLAVAGTGKLLAPARRPDWPLRRGPLAGRHGPRLVGAAELVGAAAVALAPGRLAAATALVVYALLGAVASGLRGRTCACFGTLRRAAVGRAHIAANTAAALLAVVALTAGPGGLPPGARAVTALTAAAVTAVVLPLGRRGATTGAEGHAGDASDTTDCTEPVAGVRLYTAPGCPSCRALEGLLDTLDEARRGAVTTTVLRDGERPPPPLRDLGVPAAQALDDHGRPVCAPVSGIGAVKALVDAVTVPVAGGRAERAEAPADRTHGR